jgi:hypothetical protein
VLDLVRPETIKKMVLLTDATSATPGANESHRAFLAEMSKLGMKMITTMEMAA